MFSSFDQILMFAQNDMYHRDLLVAAIATVLGLNIIYLAAINNSWVFELGTVSTLERHFGRQPARLILASLGTTLVFLGIYLCTSSGVRRTENIPNLTVPPTANVPESTLSFTGR